MLLYPLDDPARYMYIYIYYYQIYILAYLLKARTVEPEKQPLLVNGSETTFVYKQRPRYTMERRPLLGSRFLISKNRRQLLVNGSVNTFTRQRIRIHYERCFIRGPCRDILSKGQG
jgi:hypothetical protein